MKISVISVVESQVSLYYCVLLLLLQIDASAIFWLKGDWKYLIIFHIQGSGSPNILRLRFPMSGWFATLLL